MASKEPHDDDFFLRNAVLCWLHYFGEDHKWSAKYKELAERDSYAPKPKPRPARRRKPTNAVKELLT